MGLRQKLALGFGLFAAVLLVAALVPLGVLLQREHAEQEVSELLRTGEAAVAAASDPAGLDFVALNRYFPKSGRVSARILDPSGHPIIGVDNASNFPAPAAFVLSEVLNGDTKVKSLALGGRTRLVAALPLLSSGRTVGVLMISKVREPAGKQTWEVLAAVGGVVLAAAVIAGWLLARQLTDRLQRLSAAAKTFGSGDLSQRVGMDGHDEVAGVAAALDEMAGRIEQHVARQTEFVAAASHQIRTPLTSIRLRLDELREIGLTSDLSLEYLDEMTQETVRLERLTRQLMALLSADSVRPTSPVLVCAAVEEAVGRVSPLARHRCIEIDTSAVDPKLTVGASEGAVEEVLLNLIDNAVKYSPEAGRVTVAASNSDGTIAISVSDRGPGMDPGQRSQAFDAFYRASPSGPGFGLGLAIARQICASESASIDLQPRDGGGTTALVKWPSRDTGDQEPPR